MRERSRGDVSVALSKYRRTLVSNMIMVMVMVNMLMVINMAIKNIKVDWRYGELSRTKAAFYFVFVLLDKTYFFGNLTCQKLRQ